MICVHPKQTLFTNKRLRTASSWDIVWQNALGRHFHLLLSSVDFPMHQKGYVS